MSKLYRNPILVPTNLSCQLEGAQLTLDNNNHSKVHKIHPSVQVTYDGHYLTLAPKVNTRSSRIQTGTAAALLRQSIQGLTAPFTKSLTLVGVGYRAWLEGTTLNLALNFSHPVSYSLPEEVTAICTSPTTVVLSSHDAEMLGNAGACIRRLRPPEVYKGKGIRYTGESVKLKVVKKK